MLDAQLFDHTILKADATEAEVAQICAEAVAHGFMSVCVNGFYTGFVKERLSGSGVKVCTVVGFPLGQMTTGIKCAETARAVADGADEIDMVINIGALKDLRDGLVEDEIAQVKAACGTAVLKVIIEAGLLTDEEKRRACRLAVRAGADFVKTATGFAADGATAADVALMRATVGATVGVKAAGGIRDKAGAEAMVAAGANRLGCSRTVAICAR